MKFNIMSRNLCEKYITQKHKDTSIIISIKSSWDKIPPNLYITNTNNVKDILFLSFDDIEIIDTKQTKKGLITKSQAKEIVYFIEKWKNSIDKIIVHCDGGISRSAGVMAAIQRYLINDDSKIFNVKNKRPNITCYLSIIKAFEEEFGWSINNYLD